MYICICQAVTDHAIREEIKKGTHNVKALTQRFKLGKGCAKCVDEIKALIREAATDNDC